MAKSIPSADLLRLLCLQSLVGGALKAKDIESLKRRFLQVNHSVGYELSFRHTVLNIY